MRPAPTVNVMSSGQKPRRRAILVLLVASLFVSAAFIGAVAYVVLRNLEIVPADEIGKAGFDALRARYQGQMPLVVMTASGVPRVDRPDEARPRRQVKTIHVRVWVPKDRQVVKLSFPSWIARLGGAKSFALDAMNLQSINLRWEDIERHGPGLLADFQTPDQSHVLVWCE